MLYEIVQKIEKNGIDVYIVGGYVRDYLLGIKSNDIDIIVDSDKLEELKTLLTKEGFKILNNGGEKFFHIKTLYNDIEIDFALPRREKYLPNSRNPIVEKGNLKSEILRRDFTINAFIAKVLPDNSLQIINKENLHDLNNKILKCNDSPVQTFIDDPIRILRAMRFAKKYDLILHASIQTAIDSFDFNLFKKVSIERITTEIIKCLKVNEPLFRHNVLFKLLYNLGDKELKDFVSNLEEDPDTEMHIEKTMKLANKTGDNDLLLAAWLHDIGKFVTKEYSYKQKRNTYIDHENVSTNISKEILNLLRINVQYKKVPMIIENHMRIKWVPTMRHGTLIKFIKENKQILKKLVKFNEIDWKGKPLNWQEDMDTDNAQKIIINRLKKYINAFPSREEAKKFFVGKNPDVIHNDLCRIIREKLKGK